MSEMGILQHCHRVNPPIPLPTPESDSSLGEGVLDANRQISSLAEARQTLVAYTVASHIRLRILNGSSHLISFFQPFHLQFEASLYVGGEGLQSHRHIACRNGVDKRQVVAQRF